MNAALSRRAALTGAVASVAMVGAAVVVAAPISATFSTAWDAAFARYNASNAAAEADGWQDDDLANAQCNDWSELMHTPAPHIQALHWKLDSLYGTPERNGTTTDWDYGLVSVVVEDARRLAGVEASA